MFFWRVKLIDEINNGSTDIEQETKTPMINIE